MRLPNDANTILVKANRLERASFRYLPGANCPTIPEQ
jgi:hypothetical protein